MNQTGQLLKNAHQVAEVLARFQLLRTMEQLEAWGLLPLLLDLLDRVECRFVAVPEDRENGHPVAPVQRIVAPLSRHHAACIEVQKKAHFLLVEEEMLRRFSVIAKTDQVRHRLVTAPLCQPFNL